MACQFYSEVYFKLAVRWILHLHLGHLAVLAVYTDASAHKSIEGH